MSLPAFLLLTDTAENRTLCRARALSKREAFAASGRGRRQAAEAGADLRSKYADSPRKASTRYGCDVIESQPAMRHVNGTPNPRRIELCAGRRRKENAAATQGGMQFPNEWLAENPSQNRPSDRDALSRRPPHPLNSKTCALSIPKLGRRKPKRNSRRST